VKEAYTNVDKAEDEKELADLINHVGPKKLAEICKEKNGYLIHISTDYVFNGTKNSIYRNR
jgi:dTDP-4-dehydrorhamnose reductase